MEPEERAGCGFLASAALFGQVAGEAREMGKW